MDAITTDFWEVLLWSFWFFIWIAALMVWFRCLFDMFADRTLSGWGKAGWASLMIFVPWLGTIIYLIARGRSMSERQMQAAAEQQAAIVARYLNGDISRYYEGSLLMNILKMHGMDLCSLGLAECPDDKEYEEVVFIDKAKRYYKK